MCFFRPDFIKVGLKLVKQKARTGFGQPEKTTLLDYNAKRKEKSGKTGLPGESNWEKLLHVCEGNGEPKII